MSDVQNHLPLPNTRMTRPDRFRVPTLVGRAEWDATGESFWCVFNKLIHLNNLRPETIRSLFLSATRQELSELDHSSRMRRLDLQTKANFRRQIVLSSTNLTEKTYSMAFNEAFYDYSCSGGSDGLLTYCAPCLESGFHTALFQINAVDQCPWHNVRLSRGCPQCGVSINVRFPLTGKISPFLCRNGHRLWEGIDSMNWREGPSRAQRAELAEVRAYLKRSRFALRPGSAEGIALVGGYHDVNPGWDPLIHTIRTAPEVVGRLVRATDRHYKSAVSPVALDCKAESPRRTRNRLLSASVDCRGNLKALREHPAGVYFFNTFLDSALDVYDTFFAEIEEILGVHHEQCCIGLHKSPYGLGWGLRQDYCCVWRAALVIVRGSGGNRYRNYGDLERTKLALSHTESFENLYGRWAYAVWRFLDLRNDTFDHVGNVTFCRWLYRLLLREALEAAYVDAILEILKKWECERAGISTWRWSMSFHARALVDMNQRFPHVTLEMSPRTFTGSLRACRLGLHERSEIVPFLSGEDRPALRSTTYLRYSKSSKHESDE